MTKRFNLLYTAIFTIVLLASFFTACAAIGVAADGTGDGIDNLSVPTKVTKQWIVIDSFFGGYDGIAIGPDGSVYVAATASGTVKKIYPNMLPIDLSKEFKFPEGVAVDQQGNVYVADSGNDAVKIIYPNGTVKTIGSGFRYPAGVAVDARGNVYVADRWNEAIKIIFPNDTAVILYHVPYPQNIAIDNKDNLYLTDASYNIYKISTNSTKEWLGENLPRDVIQGLAVDASGNVYVSERNQNSVYVIFPNKTVASLGRFVRPSGLAVDPQGNLFVVDENAVTELSPPNAAGIIPYISLVLHFGVFEWIVTSPFWISIAAFLIAFVASKTTKYKSSALLGVAGLYLKVYMVSFLVFAVVYICWVIIYRALHLFPGGDIDSLPSLLFMGSVYASTYTIIAATAHVLNVKSKQYPISQETLNVSHTRELAVNYPIDEAFTISMSAIAALPSYKIRYADGGKGRIVARKSLLDKYGNKKMSFEIAPGTDDTSKIRVTIRPVLPTLFVDNGRSLDDIETICRYIENYRDSPGVINLQT